MWIAILFGPFGAICRHLFGYHFNGFKGYPFGTFLANIIGSTIYTILFGFKTFLTVENIPSSGAIWLAAIAGGFCSSFTTISSFVNDICNLCASKRYFYAFATIITAQVFTLFVLLATQNLYK
jgi:CrcB protein